MAFNKFKSCKLSLLSGASIAILATNSAQANDVFVRDLTTGNGSLDYEVSVRAFETVYNNLRNEERVSASVTATGGITRTDSYNGSTFASSNTSTTNTLSALAIGNTSTITVPLSLLDTSEGDDGIATLGLTIDTGYVTSMVASSALEVSLTNTNLDSSTNSNNEITAKTLINKAVTTVSGQIPNAYSSGASASALTDQWADLIFDGEDDGADTFADGRGSIVLSSLQFAERSEEDVSFAAVYQNEILLQLRSDEDATMTGSGTLADNLVGAYFTGNSSVSSLSIENGANPTFTGSASVTTAQRYEKNDPSLSEGQEAASNKWNHIIGSVVALSPSQGDIYTLTGSLTVDSNRIEASATGNASLGNIVTLENGVNFDGTENEGSLTLYTGEADLDQSVNGSLVVLTDQLVENFGEEDVGEDYTLSSQVSDALIAGGAQDLNGGSLSVSDNTISSVARNNNYSGQIATDGNVTEFDGAVAFAAQQSSYSSSVDSSISDTRIEARAGSGEDDWSEFNDGDFGIQNSSLLALGNVVSSAAYGNQLSQDIVLEATSLNANSSSNVDSYTDIEGSSDSVGSVVLGSQQFLYSSQVNADITGSLILGTSFDEEGSDGSTITVGSNEQEVFALGNWGTNGINAKATTLGSGIGIVSQQLADASSDVSASFEGAASIYIADDVGGGDDDVGSTVSLLENTQRAVAYANTVKNDLTLEATIVNLEFSDAIASDLSLDDDNRHQVVSGYSVLNTQQSMSDVIATVAPSWWDESSLFKIEVDLDVEDGSAVINDGNISLAAAYGNQATNSASLDVNALVMDDFVSEGEDSSASGIISVSNAQYNLTFDEDDLLISAQIHSASDASVLTSIDDYVEDGSSVSTSLNTLQAQAIANLSGNSLEVQATQIEAFGNIVGMGVTSGQLPHALGVHNVQSVQNATTISATLLDTFEEASDAVDVLTFVDEGIEDSSVVSLGNILSASAGANRSSNTLAVTSTGLQASTGVKNNQITSADTIAAIGIAGTSPTPEIDASTVNNVGTVGGSLSLLGRDWIVDSPVTLTFSTALTAEEAAFLNSQGGFYGAVAGGSTVNIDAGTWSTSFFLNPTTNEGLDGIFGTGDEEFSVDGFNLPGAPASDGEPVSGGVIIRVFDDIERSTVRVDNNVVKGSAIGNEALNTLTLTSTSIERASENDLSIAGFEGSIADIAVLNFQVASGTSSSEANVLSTYHIDQGEDENIYESLISVSGNAQSATAIANLAESELSVVATDFSSNPATIALNSTQLLGVFEEEASSAVTAMSVMELFAPIQSSGSTITLNSNTNRAVGILNDATSLLSLTGTNIGSVSGNDALAEGQMVSADAVLFNTQIASGLLNTNAETIIYNQDRLDIASKGVLNGSVEVKDNLTFTEASANRSVNTAIINGTANQGASVGLANNQFSAAEVSAFASTVATLDLTGTDEEGFEDDYAPLNTSSVSMAGNITEALARGNSTINALTSSAGAAYDSFAEEHLSGSYGDNVRARAIITNDQANSNSVSAQAQATFNVVLNSAEGVPSVASSTVAVGGNKIAAVAYGNQATNQLTLTPLNSGLATGAVFSTQSNTGAITATATSATFGITASASTTNASAFRTTGNAISATAVGNSVTTTIIGR